ncbi:MAG: ribosome maturation factor RimM [Actinomycetia bacterium]|nr:ribosome maturation factor RimM [Actinomycetes bacterium]
MTNQLLEVGRIGRAHGVRGQVYVDLLTDRHERLAVGARLRAGERWLTVVSARPAGSRWLVQFEGCADRNAAELLVSTALFAEPLADDADGLYVHQLIGAEVVGSDGRSYGRCVAVVANPAHDLLELEDGSLVPTVFITASSDGQLLIDPPEGLFDLGE